MRNIEEESRYFVWVEEKDPQIRKCQIEPVDLCIVVGTEAEISGFMAFYPGVEKVLERWATSRNYFGL